MTLIAESDKVEKRWTSRGTHQEEFAGIPATGRQITYTEPLLIASRQDCRGWWNYDLFGMLQQLGAIPAPGEPLAVTA